MKVDLTKEEIEMIEIGLDCADHENQLPVKGEDRYEEVLALKEKLGIKED